MADDILKPPSAVRTLRAPGDLLITPHFAVSEFDQPAKHGQPRADYPDEWIAERLRPLCEVLEVLRAELGGHPIGIISGYRTAAYNAAVHGARDSQHMQGRAADIVVEGWMAPNVQARVIALYQAGRLPRIGGLGRYPGFTHVDVRHRQPLDPLIIWDG